MPFFQLFTSFVLPNNLGPFKDLAISQMAKMLKTDEMYVTLDIKDGMNEIKNEGRHQTLLRIIYFETYFSSLLEEKFSEAGLELRRRFKRLTRDHKFIIQYKSYEDRLLIDWKKKNPLIASIPIDDQGERKNCWAYIFAYIVSCKYSQENHLVKDLGDIITSAQDLSDWAYSFHGLKVEVDSHGYYGANGISAGQYTKFCGISLLKNYEIAEYKERKIETVFDEKVFKEMWHGRGERIFIKEYNVTNPDTTLYDPGNPLNGTLSYSLELVTQILHKGIAYGKIYYCGGCLLCEGLDRFNGEGIYDEPSHPEGHAYKSHAVAVIGAGNLDGKDYISIRNTRGPDWAKNGEANIHIKFFQQFIQVSGTTKRKLGSY